MLDILQSLMGWVGAFLILLGYTLNSLGKLKATDSSYLWINLVGSLLLVINAWLIRALPFILINAFWLVVSVVGMLKGRVKK